MAIQLQIDSQSIVQLTQSLKILRAEQQALTTEGTAAYKQYEEQINAVNSSIEKQVESYSVADKSVATLKKEFRALKDLQSETSDPDQMIKFASAAGQANDKMKEVNESVAIFSGGTAFEQAGTALKQMGDNLLSLDFEGAAQKGKILEDITKNLSFEGATKSLKDLGSSFMSIGKALVMNPLFLIAAAIAGFVAIVVVVLAKLGLLKPLLDAIGKAVGAVIAAFEALTDWLGLTANAAEDNAEKVKAAQEENRKSIDETAKKQEEVYNLTKDLTDQEIADLNKKLDKDKQISTESTNIYDIKIQQAKDIKASTEEELATLQELEDFHGELTDEQKKQKDELVAKQKEATNSITSNERAKLVAIQDMNKKSMDILKSWQTKNIADANQRAKAELKIEEEKALRAIDLEIKKAKGLDKNFNTKDLEQAKLEITKYFGNESVKIDKEVQKQKTDAYNAAVDKRKSKAEKDAAELAKKTKEELDQLIYNEGLKVKATEEGSAERLAAESALYDKQIEFYNNNSKKLQISELDKNKAIDKLNEDKAKGIKVFNDKEEAENKRKNDAIFQAEQKIDQNILEIKRLGLKQLEDLETDSTEVRINKSKERESKLKDIEKIALDENVQNLNKKLEDDKQNLIKQYGNEEAAKNELLLLQNQYNSDLELLTQQSQSAITDIEKTEADARLKIAEDEKQKKAKDLQDTLDGYQKIIDALQSVRGEGNALQVDLLSNTLQGIKAFTELGSQEFNKFDNAAANMADKVNAYAQAIGSFMNGIVSAISEFSQQKSEESLAAIEENSAAEQAILDDQLENGLISQEQFDQAKYDLDKAAYDKAEVIKEKAFEDDKKAKIAQAVIAGAMGAVSAFAGAFQAAPGPAGAILGGILAAAVAGLTAFNVSKIKATKYKSSGGAPTAPSGNLGGVGGGTDSTSSAVPSFNLFGQGNNANTTNASAPVMGGEQGAMVVKAIVVESDITNSQANVARYNESATL